MPERRALIIGIDHYEKPGNDLGAAVADAEAVAALLQRHEDGEPNFDCRVFLDRMEDGSRITRSKLRTACRKLFADFSGDILFYFSGHGILTDTGGFLCTYDAEADDWGIPMQEIVDLAVASHVRNVLLILDCCHSGDIANPAALQAGTGKNLLTLLRDNMTVIAASRPTEGALEAGGHGLFTAAVLDALDGGAADHMGWVTAPAIYTYVERRFDSWGQQTIYKSYASSMLVVRECAPLIERTQLHLLPAYFPTQDFQYRLDPEYEPEDEHGNVHQPVNAAKVEIAQLFKAYRDAGLLKPSVQGEQLFWTARRSNTVELTLRGREYWRLVEKGRV